MKRVLRILILGPVMALWCLLWFAMYPFFRAADWLTDEEFDGESYWSMFPEVFNGLTR